MLIKDAIAKIVDRCDLTAAEAEAVMDQIMDGVATPAQIGAFLTALRLKGETVEEIVGCARAMRRKAVAVSPKRTDLVDTCGTGGDRAGTFNISTTAAFVVAGAGQGVAKHGNRSVSSQCGSADVLMALGVNLDLTPEQVADCIDQVGIGFLFAPKLHPAMKHAAPVRREMGIRTVFNILGPLTNPAGASAQLMGVYDEKLTAPLAGVLQALGSRCAYVVHSHDGLDELSTTGTNTVSAFCDGRVHSFQLDPLQYGLTRASLDDLRGGLPADNARITRGVLERSLDGPRRDVVLLNAGAALAAGGKAGNLREGLEMAVESLDSGAARRTLDQFIEYTQSVNREA
jgi:anthranilate phosphoribosyltransferase